jgi:hypothetical protein
MESLSLSDAESKYYNDLFSLCDVEKIGKVSKLKSDEFFRTTELDDKTLNQVSYLWQCNNLIFM